MSQGPGRGGEAHLWIALVHDRQPRGIRFGVRQLLRVEVLILCLLVILLHLLLWLDRVLCLGLALSLGLAVTLWPLRLGLHSCQRRGFLLLLLAHLGLGRGAGGAHDAGRRRGPRGRRAGSHGRLAALEAARAALHLA